MAAIDRAPLLGNFSCAFGPFEEDNLMDELRMLDAVEAGEGAERVEDDDVYKMRELIDEKPQDVIQYLEEEGVVKVGEFEVQDAVALRAFGKDTILTMGCEHFECDWETMWRDHLVEVGGRPARGNGIGWTTTVTLEAHVVNVRDAAAVGGKGLLHPLLKRYQARGCSAGVFALPAVQAVIHFKWTHWARRFLLYELACYVVWLGAFTCFTLSFEQEDYDVDLGVLLRSGWGIFSVFCNLLALAAMLPFVYMEWCTVRAYTTGWLGLWNLLDLASYVLQVVIVVLYLQRSALDEGWFSVLIATQHVLMWSKLHYFARAFNPTKSLFVDTIRIVIEDMKWFFLFLALTMAGFGFAFYALYRQDRETFTDFANLWHSMASMFSFLLAMFDYHVFYDSTNPTAAMLLFMLFSFVMDVLMLNILIATMTTSFSKVQQDEGLRFLTSKAEIIDELETTLPSWLRPTSWHPHFVHVLKFHPESQYEISLSSVWSGIGLMESNLLNAQTETRLLIDGIEDRLNRLHRKLDVLVKMTLGLMPASQQRLAAVAAGLRHDIDWNSPAAVAAVDALLGISGAAAAGATAAVGGSESRRATRHAAEGGGGGAAPLRTSGSGAVHSPLVPVVPPLQAQAATGGRAAHETGGGAGPRGTGAPPLARRTIHAAGGISGHGLRGGRHHSGLRGFPSCHSV